MSEEAERRKQWEDKKATIESNIKEVKESLKEQNKILDSNLEKALQTKSGVTKNSAMKTVQLAKESIRKLSEELDEFQTKLLRHVSKS